MKKKFKSLEKEVLMTAEDNILAAADVIQQRGFHKKWFFDTSQPMNSAPVCIMGAFRVVNNGNPMNNGPAMAMSCYEKDLIAEVVGAGDIPQWNDYEGRTKDEVIQALHDAARRAR